MPEQRLGVALSALKARILDLVQQGGEDGMPCETVWRTVFQPRHGSRETMKAHVWQINEKLADEGWRIVCDRALSKPHYRLVKVSVRRRAKSFHQMERRSA